MKFKVGDLVKLKDSATHDVKTLLQPPHYQHPLLVTEAASEDDPNQLIKLNGDIGWFASSIFELVQEAPQKLLNAVDILEQGKSILNQRGEEYEASEGTGERSFNSVATAFNAITGKDLTPAEVCLVLQIVKDVRQWSQDRLHSDSILDGVNYAALKGEELYKQYGVRND